MKKRPPPRRRRVLQRVPAPLRGNDTQKLVYDPVVVPLGTYHHGRLPEYQVAEQLKEEILDMVCGDRDRGVPLGLVSESLARIRRFYGGADGYGDGELAAMMFRDTCFVLCCIKRAVHKCYGIVVERLGLAGSIFMYRDLSMLENQIPLWLLNLLIPFFAPDINVELLLRKFLSSIYYYQGDMPQLPWVIGQGRQPLHLLEASHCALLQLAKTDQDQDEENDHDHDQGSSSTNPHPPESTWQLYDSPFRSATELKAKGVRFGPSSHSLMDISFFSSATHGRLHLPLFRINPNSRTFLSNLVAFEMTSDGYTETGFVSYVNFMKTLLRKAEDVKLLREKGVLYSTLADDDEVVRLFQDTDTTEISGIELYNVRMGIENNRGKTWLVELINTYFRSPLTAVALFVAAFILVLTLLQTFYTIRP